MIDFRNNKFIKVLATLLVFALFCQQAGFAEVVDLRDGAGAEDWVLAIAAGAIAGYFAGGGGNLIFTFIKTYLVPMLAKEIVKAMDIDPNSPEGRILTIVITVVINTLLSYGMNSMGGSGDSGGDGADAVSGDTGVDGADSAQFDGADIGEGISDEASSEIANDVANDVAQDAAQNTVSEVASQTAQAVSQSFWESVWNVIKDIGKQLWDSIWGLIKTPYEILSKIWQALTSQAADQASDTLSDAAETASETTADVSNTGTDVSNTELSSESTIADSVNNGQNVAESAGQQDVAGNVAQQAAPQGFWSNIGTFFTKIWNSFANVFKNIWDKLSMGFKQLWTSLKQLWTGQPGTTSSDTASETLEDAGEGATGAESEFPGSETEIAGSVAEGTSPDASGATSDIADQASQQATSGGFFYNLGNFFYRIGKTLWDGLYKIGKNIYDQISKGIKQLLNLFSSKAKDATTGEGSDVLEKTAGEAGKGPLTVASNTNLSAEDTVRVMIKAVITNAAKAAAFAGVKELIVQQFSKDDKEIAEAIGYLGGVFAGRMVESFFQSSFGLFMSYDPKSKYGEAGREVDKDGNIVVREKVVGEDGKTQYDDNGKPMYVDKTMSFKDAMQRQDDNFYRQFTGELGRVAVEVLFAQMGMKEVGIVVGAGISKSLTGGSLWSGIRRGLISAGLQELSKKTKSPLHGAVFNLGATALLDSFLTGNGLNGAQHAFLSANADFMSMGSGTYKPVEGSEHQMEIEYTRGSDMFFIGRQYSYVEDLNDKGFGKAMLNQFISSYHYQAVEALDDLMGYYVGYYSKAELSAKYNKFNEDLAAMKDAAERKKQAVNELETKLDALLKAYNETYAATDKKKIAIENKLAEMRKNATDNQGVIAEYEKLSNERDNLANQLLALGGAIENCKKELDKASEGKYSGLVQEYNKLISERENLQKQLSNKGISEQQKQDILSQIGKIDKKITDILTAKDKISQGRRKELGDKLKELTKQYNEARDKMQKNLADLTKVAEKLAATDKEYVELREERDKLQKKLDQMKRSGLGRLRDILEKRDALNDKLTKAGLRNILLGPAFWVACWYPNFLYITAGAANSLDPNQHKRDLNTDISKFLKDVESGKIKLPKPPLDYSAGYNLAADNFKNSYNDLKQKFEDGEYDANEFADQLKKLVEAYAGGDFFPKNSPTNQRESRAFDSYSGILRDAILDSLNKIIENADKVDAAETDRNLENLMKELDNLMQGYDAKKFHRSGADAKERYRIATDRFNDALKDLKQRFADGEFFPRGAAPGDRASDAEARKVTEKLYEIIDALSRQETMPQNTQANTTEEQALKDYSNALKDTISNFLGRLEGDVAGGTGDRKYNTALENLWQELDNLRQGYEGRAFHPAGGSTAQPTAPAAKEETPQSLSVQDAMRGLRDRVEAGEFNDPVTNELDQARLAAEINRLNKAFAEGAATQAVAKPPVERMPAAAAQSPVDNKSAPVSQPAAKPVETTPTTEPKVERKDLGQINTNSDVAGKLADAIAQSEAKRNSAPADPNKIITSNNYTFTLSKDGEKEKTDIVVPREVIDEYNKKNSTDAQDARNYLTGFIQDKLDKSGILPAATGDNTSGDLADAPTLTREQWVKATKDTLENDILKNSSASKEEKRLATEALKAINDPKSKPEDVRTLLGRLHEAFVDRITTEAEIQTPQEQRSKKALESISNKEKAMLKALQNTNQGKVNIPK